METTYVDDEIGESPTVETVTFNNSEDNNDNNNDSNNMLREPLLVDDNNEGTSSSANANISSVSSRITHIFNEIVDIYSDQSGSCMNLTKGLSIVAFLGAFLGLIMPKDTDLPSPFYRYISSMIGYMYFVAWSVSFYPQIITNYQNKSIDGLSTDAMVLAVLNYICYTTYNAFFFWDETIRQDYKDRNGADAEITVQSNDVAFSINALVLTLFTLGQIFYYGGFSTQPLSRTTKGIIGATVGLSLLYILGIFFHVPNFDWIDFLYIMATVKLILTVMTYIPQIVLNYKRKSTQGFNIWNVIFDFSGGLLSLIQLYFDCVDMNDYGGILGNWAKLVLSLITLVFDGIYFLQHYVLYRNNSISSEMGESEYSPVEVSSPDNGFINEFV
mmetsp:Transcript_8488/g.12742  ORF Transcript_8488/g.12742 Transcript_8488/m.12742 type:complete len:386 (+) Transcript_8488:169-1326(+)|eukprot:CAMPEP_0203676110 /NCGR_PEP_ID=MMETSP0090-20130426/23362_1 /ASSEMBLY_ACC=CAM_ASM_001088 /TAXON_ID=426623 /ORGANISM="Chaetoceros affinis, Strain CCMP159" /LENGTH=385 /DNA_ID=CAMNT_0050542537 /DNA_START=32 /DNA_END=1189 /DNA_ORIENTATION=+